MNTLLDTNVLSELLRSAPEPMVLAWLAAHPSETLFVSAVTQAEMMLGARLLCRQANGGLLWKLRSARCSARTLPDASCRSTAQP